ncbi:MAG: amidase domain-containing protein [Sulfobacillus sp.]|nr:amidase domain-containing protein [Sulfobacillus sp.]
MLYISRIAIIRLGLSVIVGGVPSPKAALVPLTPAEQAVKQALTALVTHEDQAILAQNPKALRAVFVPGASSAEDAFDHARDREVFLAAWAKARQIRLQAVTVTVRTPHITFQSPERVKVFAVVSENYTYRYRPTGPLQHFGLGIRHDYVLQAVDRQWRIRADDFTDPLDQDTRIPQAAKPATDTPRVSVPHQPPAPLNKNAEAAVRYADEYCGAAPGCGNHGFYNRAYNNYNGEGGDCTNFISQALKAGGFRETAGWSYDRHRGEGNRAWSNAVGLAEYLDASGRATSYAEGRYPSITRPTERFPHGAIAALRPGDLISYVERGRPIHTAMVTGFDSKGVPLVDSHTSDRYHVPWDLGWDRSTRYILWHVHYPDPSRQKTLP